jgi:hypothetical protein
MLIAVRKCPLKCRCDNERRDQRNETAGKGKYHDCAKVIFLRGGVWLASLSEGSSCSTLRLTPTSLEGDDDGDLERERVTLTTGGVDREEITSGVDARLPVPNSDLSRVTKLLADAVASA